MTLCAVWLADYREVACTLCQSFYKINSVLKQPGAHVLRCQPTEGFSGHADQVVCQTHDCSSLNTAREMLGTDQIRSYYISSSHTRLIRWYQAGPRGHAGIQLGQPTAQTCCP